MHEIIRGSASSLPRNFAARVDLVEIELRKGVMDKLEPLEPCRLPPESHIFRQRDIDVLLLA